MAINIGKPPIYGDSGSSTTAVGEKSIGVEPTYETKTGTGTAEYGTSKPTRMRFQVQRIERAGA